MKEIRTDITCECGETMAWVYATGNSLLIKDIYRCPICRRESIDIDWTRST
jgi:hypothetical protein